MKLLVGTNFARPFHMGGSEKVVQQITESFAKDDKNLATVISQYGNSPVTYNGINVIPLGKYSEEVFIKQVQEENPNHFFIYGDWFFRLPTILKNIDKFCMPMSIAMVGMNRLRSLLHKDIAELYKKHSNRFKIIVHSDSYIDSKTCKEWGLSYTVIPNGIDLCEFAKTDFDFRKHYGIKTEKMILCVSNFFPGKGQEYLVPIIKQLSERHKDFTFVFISTTVMFEAANRIRLSVKENCKRFGLPVLFLEDIPRDHVVQSYFACDFFVFSSQQEVFPVVILESMAARKPWVSLDVGCVSDLSGGLIIRHSSVQNGFVKYTNDVNSSMFSSIERFLNDDVLCKFLGEQGFLQIQEKYNWQNISDKYRDFFHA